MHGRKNIKFKNKVLRIYGHNTEVVTGGNCVMKRVFNKEFKDYQIKED